MKAGETTVLRLLQGEKVFLIPNFQRRYAWRQKEWEELWNDLMREYEAPHDRYSQELEGHFLGSVVLHPAPGPASTLMRHLVIDGQQRLTTLLVLLAALRDVRRVAEPDWNPESYDAKYLTNPFDDSYPDRLVPTEFDRTPYRETVRYGRPTGGIGQAYTYFRGRIEKEYQSGRVDLAKLGDTILIHFLVVEINTSTGDSVNNIFNTLNSKGRPLGATDLIRNELLLNLNEESAAFHYDEYWRPMERRLVKEDSRGNLDDSLFITFFWAREVGVASSVTKKSLFQYFERRLRSKLDQVPSRARQERVEEYFTSIFRDFQVFLKVLDPLGSSDAPFVLGVDLANALDALRRWGSEPYLPTALWIVTLYAEGRVSEEDATGALRVLLGYLVRRALFGVPTNNLNRLLTPVPTQLEPRVDDSGIQNALIELLSRSGYRWPTDSEVLAGVASQPLYLSIKRIQTRFLLESLERAIAGREVADMRTMSIEHVLPQSIPERWRHYLTAEGADVEAAEASVHTLGNLTLTGYNSTLSDSLFAEKSVLLAQSPLKMNRAIASVARWTPAEIGERASDLGRTLVTLFPGPPTGAADESRVSEASPDGEVITAALQSMPEGAWTTDGELAQALGLTQVAVRSAVVGMGPELARLVLDPSGRVPAWMPAKLQEQVARQLTPGTGTLFTAEALAELLVEPESPIEELLAPPMPADQ